MDDRTLENLLEVLSLIAPVLILCVFRWRARGIAPGAVVYYALTVWMLLVRSRFDHEGGLAGVLLILGGIVGLVYSSVVWLLGFVVLMFGYVAREGFRKCCRAIHNHMH